MKSLVFATLLTLMLSACSVQHPGSGFGPGLLTREAMSQINASTDPKVDAGPWFTLSKSELIALIGPPQAIESHVKNDRIFAETLHYIQGTQKFSFIFEGDRMFGMMAGEVPRFSDTSFSEESYQLTNPFHDFPVSNLAYVAFSGGLVPGPYFVTRDHEEILALYEAASKLNPELSFGSACGILCHASFCDKDGKELSVFSVHACGDPIYASDPNGLLDKSIASHSEHLRDLTFNLVLKHSPEILSAILELDSPCVQSHVVPKWPFEKLKRELSVDVTGNAEKSRRFSEHEGACVNSGPTNCPFVIPTSSNSFVLHYDATHCFHGFARIDIHDTGRKTVIAVETDADGNSPRLVNIHECPEEDYAVFTNLLAKAGFWQMRQTLPQNERPQALDGRSIVLAAQMNGKQHTVERYCPTNALFKTACSLMQGVAFSEEHLPPALFYTGAYDSIALKRNGKDVLRTVHEIRDAEALEKTLGTPHEAVVNADSRIWKYFCADHTMLCVKIDHSMKINRSYLLDFQGYLAGLPLETSDIRHEADQTNFPPAVTLPTSLSNRAPVRVYLSFNLTSTNAFAGDSITVQTEYYCPDISFTSMNRNCCVEPIGLFTATLDGSPVFRPCRFFRSKQASLDAVEQELDKAIQMLCGTNAYEVPSTGTYVFSSQCISEDNETLMIPIPGKYRVYTILSLATPDGDIKLRSNPVDVFLAPRPGVSYENVYEKYVGILFEVPDDSVSSSQDPDEDKNTPTDGT